MKIRRFKLNTHLTFPIQLMAGPGASYHRAQPGHTVEISSARCAAHERFLRGRIRAGDMVELEAEPVTAVAPTTNTGGSNGGASK